MQLEFLWNIPNTIFFWHLYQNPPCLIWVHWEVWEIPLGRPLRNLLTTTFPIKRHSLFSLLLSNASKGFLVCPNVWCLSHQILFNGSLGQFCKVPAIPLFASKFPWCMTAQHCGKMSFVSGGLCRSFWSLGWSITISAPISRHNPTPSLIQAYKCSMSGEKMLHLSSCGSICFQVGCVIQV